MAEPGAGGVVTFSGLNFATDGQVLHVVRLDPGRVIAFQIRRSSGPARTIAARLHTRGEGGHYWPTVHGIIAPAALVADLELGWAKLRLALEAEVPSSRSVPEERAP